MKYLWIMGTIGELIQQTNEFVVINHVCFPLWKFAGRAVVDDDVEILEVLVALFPGLANRIDWCKNKGWVKSDVRFASSLHFHVIALFSASLIEDDGAIVGFSFPRPHVVGKEGMSPKSLSTLNGADSIWNTLVSTSLVLTSGCNSKQTCLNIVCHNSKQTGLESNNIKAKKTYLPLGGA